MSLLGHLCLCFLLGGWAGLFETAGVCVSALEALSHKPSGRMVLHATQREAGEPVQRGAGESLSPARPQALAVFPGEGGCNII